MTDTPRSRLSPEAPDACAERNAQDGGTASPLDGTVPTRIQVDPKAQDAIERATAVVGEEEPGQGGSHGEKASADPREGRSVAGEPERAK